MSDKLPSLLYVIDGRKFGGGERVFLQLATGLNEDFNIFVAAAAGGDFEKKIKKAGIKFLPVEMDKQLSIKPILQLKNIMLENSIDIVHSQGARADFFSRFSGRIAGVNNILCTITMPVEGFDVGFIKKKIYRFFDYMSERYSSCFVVVSEALKRMLIEKRRISDKQIVRIYNGIELDRCSPISNISTLKDQFGIPGDAQVVGYFGRLVWQKGIEYLLDAIPTVLSRFKNTRFLIVGDGPEKSNLLKKATALKIEKQVIFTGFIIDIEPLLTIVDTVVIPSVREGFPMITLEAMAMAKPIVATNIPGINEQVDHERSGILVQARNPGAIAKAIIALFKNKDMAHRLGLKARYTAEKNFTLEKTLDETRKLYTSLLR